MCEEVARFFINSRSLTLELKRIRHALNALLQRSVSRSELIGARDVSGDVGKASLTSELTRRSLRDVFWANAQRVKESLRVLEEFSKLSDPRSALRYKKLRYRTYAVEKKALTRLSSVCRR